jgi:hypothetical protein
MTRYSNVGIPQLNGQPLYDVEAQWIPILDRPTFDAIRARLTGGTQHQPARTYLLSWILICGKCGRDLVGMSGRYRCYGWVEDKCWLTISPAQADPRAIQHTKQMLLWFAGQDFSDPFSSRGSAQVEQALAGISAERQQIAESGLDLNGRIALLKALEARRSELEARSVSMATSTPSAV